jgi:hypothetical protein
MSLLRRFCQIVILLTFAAAANAQHLASALPQTSGNPVLGELIFSQVTQEVSSKLSFNEPVMRDESAPSKKSPYLAAALSLVLPGLGEYYVGDDIWRGIIFTALDAGLLYGNIRFNNRGDDSTTAFQAWADSLWLPSKYADSLNVLLASINSGYRIINPDDFSQINRAEDTLSLSFLIDLPLSHRLPERGSQQYYELISKYIQFTFGWRDAKDRDPLHSYQYMRHAEMRANMNHQYEIADYFLWGMFLNRILSAIDAVLLANNHNSALRLTGSIERRDYGFGLVEIIPSAHLTYRF